MRLCAPVRRCQHDPAALRPDLCSGLLRGLGWGVAAAVLLLPPAHGAEPAAAGAAVPRSLAPLDVEAFRSRHGPQALFRLRLGADAGFEAASSLSCSGFQPDWPSSPQRTSLEAALAAARPFEAGRSLGQWQALAQRCR